MVYHSEPHRVRGDFSLPLAALPVSAWSVVIMLSCYVNHLLTAIMYIVYQSRDLYMEYHQC